MRFGRADAGATAPWRRRRGIFALAAALAVARPAFGAEATIAVAASVLEAAERLASVFSQDTGHDVSISSGSTGQLYAEIVSGAPFDALLAADRERPRRLEAEGRAVAGSRFTYAVGRLALWSADPERIGEDGAASLRGRFRHLAIAEPKLAPYGEAARETLEALGLWEELEPRLVRGQDVGQTFQFVATANAELGFVALSQLLTPGREVGGSRWVVPARLHAPVRQDAVLLSRARQNEAARAFLDFLRSPPAAAVLASFGYDSGSSHAGARE